MIQNQHRTALIIRPDQRNDILAGACLAIALNRGYAVVSDDRKRKFFREVTRRLGSARIIGTVETRTGGD